jgi:membrane protein
MDANTDSPGQTPTVGQRTQPWHKTLADTARARYDGSFPKQLVTGLNDVNFGDRIIIFGSSMLLSVLPLFVVLSAFANYRVDDNIAQHLGLSSGGARVVEELFRAPRVTFNLGILIGLLLSLAGTISVARSVQAIYERTFGQPPAQGMPNMFRCLIWVVVVTAVSVADSAIGRTLRDGPAGPFLLGLIEFAGFTLFFWWSMHYLLHGREPWRRLRPAAIATAILWVGLGVFAAFYFSSSTVSDSKTYGPIGVTIDLVTWFIAIGAVLTLGAVVGAVWYERRSGARQIDAGASEPHS